MLEKFEIEGNENRQKVIDYIRNSKFKLDYFTVKDYSEYPGGLELVDKENRSIIIYYDTLLYEKIFVVYKDLKRTDEDLQIDIRFKLWSEYSILSQETNQAARINRHKGMIQFYRYNIEKPEERTHTSVEFNEVNQQYDIYYYLQRQIKRLKVEKEELY